MKNRWEYVDLKVRQKSMDLVDQIYIITKKFPKEEMFWLTSQLRRAGTSIPLNIGEWNSRKTDKDFARFLSIAHGSCVEVEVAIRISYRQWYIQGDAQEDLLQKTQEIKRMLWWLSNSLSV